MAQMIDGMILLVGVYTLWSQRGWVPILAAKAKGMFGGGEAVAPDLNAAAVHVEELERFFKHYGCKDGQASALKCGELLSLAKFQRKAANATA